MAISKVVYGGNTLIDLTEDTITENDLKEGVTAHGADGEEIVGSLVESPWTSGIYQGEDGYIYVSPYEAAGGAVLKDNIVYLFDTKTFSITENYDILDTGIVPSNHTAEVIAGGSLSIDYFPVDERAYITSITVTMNGVDITDQAFIRPLGSRTFTANGTYNPASEDLSGYSEVTVDVEGGSTLGTKSINTNGTYTATDDSLDGYSQVTVNVPTGSANLQAKTGITPATSSQTIEPDSGYDGLSSVQINAMPTGTEGTPTATKGTVSNNSVSVTPSVTNSAGYISGSTKTGTVVTVSASELVYGTKSISANGTGIDVTNYASVDVAVPATTPSLQAKTNISPTESSQTISADSGYDGLSSVQINAISSSYVGSGITRRSSSDLTASGATVTAPAGYYETAATKTIASGTAGTPTATKGTVSNHSISVTPSVTNSAGYISGGTHTGTAVTVSASELVSGSETKTTNGTYDVTNLAELVVDVPSSSSKNIQVYSGYARRQANSYGATDVTLTVSKTGTYNVSWIAWRSSSSGTMGTNLHVNNSSGTNQQTFTGTYGQCITLTNQSYSQGDVLTLYATSGSTSRSLYVGNLIIEEA